MESNCDLMIYVYRETMMTDTRMDTGITDGIWMNEEAFIALIISPFNHPCLFRLMILDLQYVCVYIYIYSYTYIHTYATYVSYSQSQQKFFLGSRARPASLLYPRVAREPDQKRIKPFSQGNPLSKFIINFQVYPCIPNMKK